MDVNDSPEVDEAEANSHEAEARIALIFFSQILHFDFWPHFSPKPYFSVDFRRDFKNFDSKRALTWKLY